MHAQYVLVQLPNEFWTLFNRRIWFWFLYVTWNVSFILLVDYCISTQFHQCINLFICPFI